MSSRRLSGWLKVQKESVRLRKAFPKPIRKLGGAALRSLERWNRSNERQKPTQEEVEIMQSRFAPEVALLKEYMEQHQPETTIPKWVTRITTHGTPL